jgi:restriction system protein
MSLPPRVEMYGPTIAVLRQSGGSATIDEIVDGVAEMMKLADPDINVPHGAGPRTELDYQLAWVRTELKNAGILSNSERRVWSLTPKGRTLGSGSNDLATELKQINRVATTESLPKTEAEDWKESLLSILLSMPPDAFERLAQRLLREKGFIQVRVEGRTGDGGIDGRGFLRLSLVGLNVVFQCKRQRGPIGPDIVRELRGAVHGRADRGLLITTSRYTPKAQEEATRTAPAIELLDGNDLCDLLKELGLGVALRNIEVVDVDTSFFATI